MTEILLSTQNAEGFMSAEDEIEKYDPAETIVRYLGGKDHVAKILDLSRGAVYYWMVGRDRGGSSGVISLKNIRKLLEYADANMIDLRATDFVESFRLKAIMSKYSTPRARKTCVVCKKGCHDPVPQYLAPWMIEECKRGVKKRNARSRKK